MIEIVKELLVDAFEGSAWGPDIVALSNGGFVVTWTAVGNSVRAQVFDAAGEKIGPEFAVDTSGANNDPNPAATALMNGGYVLTWYSDETNEGSINKTTRAQMFGASGESLGAEILVNSGSSAVGWSPDIAALNDGGFVVSWEEALPGNDVFDPDVRARVYSPIGSPVGVEFTVNSSLDSSQWNPKVAALSNGNFIIAWDEGIQTTAGLYSEEIRAQIFSSSGAKLGSEISVNTTIANNQNSPTVSGLANGGFVITWVDTSWLESVDDYLIIRAQLFDEDGFKVGPELQVNSTLMGSAFDNIIPAVTALPNGGFLVTWENVSASEIRAQVFDATGTKFGTEFQISTTTSGFVFSPAITTLANGDLVVAWANETQIDEASFRAEIFRLVSSPELEFAAKYVAYNGSFEDQLPGYTLESVINLGTFQAVAMISDLGQPILAVRGTDPTLLDWLHNSNPRAAGYAEAEAAWGQIRTWIADHPGAHIVGHSQGGAQAQMFAAWATGEGLSIGNVYTFNSPGIADTDLTDFNPALALSVKHFVSSGDIVSMVGDSFLPGDVSFYNIKGISDPFFPFSLLAAAHAGHGALGSDSFPSLGSGADFQIVGALSSSELSSGTFSYLTASGHIDTEYFSFLVGVALTSFLGLPGPALAKALVLRDTAEQLRDTVGFPIFAAVEAVQLTARGARIIVEAAQTAAEWATDAFEVLKWTLDTWTGIAKHFTADVWDAAGAWTSTAISEIGSWTSTQWDRVSTWSAQTWGQVSAWTTATWQASLEWSADKFNKLAELGADVIQFVDAKVDAVNAAVADFGETAYEYVVEKAAGFGDWLRNTAENVHKDVTGTLNQVANSIVVAATTGSALQAGSGSMFVLGAGADTVSLTGGGNGIFGTAAGLNGDIVTGFGFGDKVVVLGVNLLANALRVESGSAILHLDADGNGTEETTIRLEGNFQIDRFYLNQTDGDTEVRYAPNEVIGSNDADRLGGSPLAETIQALAGNDLLLGYAGNDMLDGSDGEDSLYGDNGNDTLIGGAGADQLNGGNDTDTAYYYGSSAGVIVVLTNGGAGTGSGGDAEGDVLTGIENVVGSNGFGDTLIGDEDGNYLAGLGGNDTLIGGSHSVGGWNTLDGGGDSDTVDYSSENGKVYADLSLVQDVGYIDNGSGFVFNDALISIENLTGGANNDQLTGDSTANVLNGHLGNDVINGGGGDDTLLGGGKAVGGFDVLYGEGGSDTASFEGVTAAVYADLLANNQTGVGVAYLNAGAGFVHESLLFTMENLTGGSGNDILLGDVNGNRLRGSGGADFMLGQDGADTLIGGEGDDSLYGGDGADRFEMDGGLDIATGGTGADVFYWNSMIQGADVVSDFSHAEGDKIHLDAAAFGVPVGWPLTAGFNFISGAGATATNATATIMFDTATNILWYDIDGTGASGRQAITFLSNGGGGITAGDVLFV